MTITKEKIILIGGGGHCRSCIEVLEQSSVYEIAGIVDKTSEATSKSIQDYPILGSDDDLPRLRKNYQHALIAIGQIYSPDTRIRLYQRLKELEFQLPVIRSPFSVISKHANIGEGTIVMHHAVVNAGAKVGNNCILNTKCLVEHDAWIGNHTHISTGAIVNGGTRIGDHCFIGSNATVIHDIEVMEGSFIRAGAIHIK